MAVALAGVGAVVAAPPASAAVGCRVGYTVTATWPGGFGANVTITNLGDPINGWTLVWSYAAGQAVTQAWNATVTQSGSQVTARNVGYNGSLATNGNTSFGFNGSWNGSNPAPTSFTLNQRPTSSTLLDPGHAGSEIRCRSGRSTSSWNILRAGARTIFHADADDAAQVRRG
jgi:hypothetical protein